MKKRTTEEPSNRLADLLARVPDEAAKKFCAELQSHGMTRDESRELYELLKDLRG